MRKIRVIDSHTEGEPTRLVVGGVDEPAGTTIQERVASFEDAFHSTYRPLLLEPRAYEAVVGAWIGPPTEPSCLHDLIFFNPAGTLGMCGHGTIGIAATLAQTGQISPGEYRFNTPVGVVTVKMLDEATVQVENVRSFRISHGVAVQVEGYGPVVGDVAYGGNHFFLVKNSPVEVVPNNLDAMLAFTKATLVAAQDQLLPEINHVELYGRPTRSDADSKNFVLCPGGEYDRSPCGTGTSAKLACLAADHALAPGQIWTQESIIGTAFRAWYRESGEGIRPTIEGSAYVTGESDLCFRDKDPLARGIWK